MPLTKEQPEIRTETCQIELPQAIIETFARFLVPEIRKYYDSIDHGILKKLLRKAFAEDKKVIDLLNVFIDSYSLTDEKGLPLGNQSSQWFALYYLDGIDRLIKEQFRVKYYTRYMDDGILIHNDRKQLVSYLKDMEKHLMEERALEFNQKTQIIPLSQGVDYLGFHFYMTENGKVIRKLRASNKKRVKRRKTYLSELLEDRFNKIFALLEFLKKEMIESQCVF